MVRLDKGMVQQLLRLSNHLRISWQKLKLIKEYNLSLVLENIAQLYTAFVLYTPQMNAFIMTKTHHTLVLRIICTCIIHWT